MTHIDSRIVLTSLYCAAKVRTDAAMSERIAWVFPMQVTYLFLSEGCLSGKLYLNDGITHECGICIARIMSLPL